MVAVPLLFGTAYALGGVREACPALYTIMILQMRDHADHLLGGFRGADGARRRRSRWPR